MSNIPKARSLLIDLLPALSGEHRAVVNDALALMFREECGAQSASAVRARDGPGRSPDPHAAGQQPNRDIQ